MNKKVLKISIIIEAVVIVVILSTIIGVLVVKNKNVNDGKANNNKAKEEEVQLLELPKPEITGGSRGELGIDKNINESTIDNYLNRKDSVYRDMRMFEDPANYEAIGGDRFLSGYIEGFTVVPLPYLIPVTGLPDAVGETYNGTTLFYNDNGTYVANYQGAMSIIERLFPKDKVIFLMCGGGGYAGMTKNFLVSLGWDADKIYNIGGYWNYRGEHNVNVKKIIDGVVTYDFDSVPYYDVQFDKLIKTTNYKPPTVAVSEIKLNTNKIELEERVSFSLNAIVLPNEATDKTVKWTSSNESVATVTDYGLVRAVKEGSATIKVESADGKRSATCEVIVHKEEIGDPIILDDISKEIEEFSSYDLNKLYRDFDDKVGLKRDSEGNFILNEYHEFDGIGYVANDLWKAEYAKYEQELDYYIAKRLEIFNRVVEGKKTFIVIIDNTSCQATYDASGAAQKILKDNNYQFFNVGGSVNGDTTFYESKLDITNYKYGSIAIIKEGKLYASSDPNEESFKSEEDIINWLSKYIKIS